MNLHLTRVAIATCLSLMLSRSSLAGGVLPFQTVALSGQAAPGTSGRIFSFFYPPSIGNSGRVIFPGWLTGVTSNDEGLWTGLPGSIELVAREGSAAPGTTAVFGQNSWTSPSCVNSSGVVAFSASLTGPGVNGTNNTGIWAGLPGAIALVARGGNPAPGTSPGVLYAGALQNWLILNDAGQLLFRGALTGPGVDSSNDFGFWAGAPGALQIVAREGDVAPGTGGRRFGPFNGPFIDNPVPVMNATGQVVFAANDSSGRGIWRWTGGTLELVTHTGFSASGTSVNFVDLRDPWMTASGIAAFLASLDGEGVDFTNNRGIWSGVPGAVGCVVRKGTSAPGAGGNYLVLNADSVGLISIDDGGYVSFPSSTWDGVSVSGPDGVWQYGPGPGTWAGSALVIEGMPAPGLSGVDFDDVSAGGPHPTGSMLVAARLSGTNVNGSNDDSLWLKDVGSGPVLLAREGDLIDVGNGVLRTIGGITTAIGGSRQSCYNSNRQMVIGLSFVGGTSGIFAANIPTPTTLGDMNCDGEVNTADVPHFFDALLTAPSFGGCDINRADMNADALINGLDTQPFVAAVLAPL